MTIDKTFIGGLLDKAASNPRLRINYDMRTTVMDGSQRMLNALLPGTKVDIHSHKYSDESVLILYGALDIVFYNNRGEEQERVYLDPSKGLYGCQIAKGLWHSVDVHEPSVIFEAKDGPNSHDASDVLDLSEKQVSHFENSLGDLKKNIEYLIGMERHSGSMEVITPLYVSRMLNVPLDEVESVMKEMGL